MGLRIRLRQTDRRQKGLTIEGCFQSWPCSAHAVRVYLIVSAVKLNRDKVLKTSKVPSSSITLERRPISPQLSNSQQNGVDELITLQDKAYI